MSLLHPPSQVRMRMEVGGLKVESDFFELLV
jgi:hypothetical protein